MTRTCHIPLLEFFDEIEVGVKPCGILGCTVLHNAIEERVRVLERERDSRLQATFVQQLERVQCEMRDLMRRNQESLEAGFFAKRQAAAARMRL